MAKRVKRKALYPRKPEKPIGRKHLSTPKDRSSDPFEIIGQIPDGVIYQWVATAVCGDCDLAKPGYDRMVGDGWRPVPWKRHPKMPRGSRGRIVTKYQELMERPKALSDEARKEEVDAALAMRREADEQFGFGRDRADPHPWPRFTVRDDEYVNKAQIESAKESLGSLGERYYAEIDVKIGLCISENEIETALMWHISPQEYALRKFLMRADVLQLQNGHTMGNREHVKIFNFVRLTTEAEA